mgnify:CR=1 FL=1
MLFRSHLGEPELFAGWAPGSTQGWYPQGSGKRLPAQAVFAAWIAGSGLLPPAAGISIAGTTMYAGPADEFREDNITVIDIRAEKRFQLGKRARLQAMFDAFNLTNSHAAETLSRATNPQFQKPTAILAPLTTRVGFRITF